MSRRIIKSNSDLLKHFDVLQRGDIVLGRIRLRPGEDSILLDLLQLGVIMIPSALSQSLSHSKSLQARLLGYFMLPATKSVYDKHDMMAAVGEYNIKGIAKVIVKLDRSNGGQGILLFNSIEEIHNQAALGHLGFPFVIQPFAADCIDVRVVMLGEMIDSYSRINPNNFRQNLHCGGTSKPWPLTEELEQLCRRIMTRADFPYAHIDFLITPEQQIFLSEINLRGGLRGSRLTQRDYCRQVERIHSHQLDLLKKSISKY